MRLPGHGLPAFVVLVQRFVGQQFLLQLGGGDDVL
jgi:hypothetical protein